MSKEPQYILAYPINVDGGDYSEDRKELCLTLVLSKQTEDLTALMKEHGIEAWATKPLDTWESWDTSTGKLLEFREVNVVPMKIVKEWGINPVIKKGFEV